MRVPPHFKIIVAFDATRRPTGEQRRQAGAREQRIEPRAGKGNMLVAVVLDDDVTVGQILVMAAQGVGFEARWCEEVPAFIEAIGAWDPTQDEVVALPELPEPRLLHVKRFPDYAYDMHTRRGKQLIEKWERSIGPGIAMPPGLDLRWTGMMYGVGWRYFAFDQFGKTDVPWEDVKIAKRTWKMLYEKFSDSSADEVKP